MMGMRVDRVLSAPGAESRPRGSRAVALEFFYRLVKRNRVLAHGDRSVVSADRLELFQRIQQAPVFFDLKQDRDAVAVAVGYVLLFCVDYVRFLCESLDRCSG